MSDVKFSVNFIYRDGTHLMPLKLPVSNEPTLVDVVRKAISSLGTSAPRTFEKFVLENQSHQIIVSTSTIVENEILDFYSPETIAPLSSGSWSPAVLKQLKVGIETLTMAEFFGRFNLVDDGNFSVRADQLVETIKDISHEFLTHYNKQDQDSQLKLRNSTIHCHPLAKALFLMQKYVSCEALVDSFIAQLFSALGYNDGMLSIVPQFKMNLHFGGGNDKESIPDFLIMDILSYLKMVIVEDKNWSLMKFNSFPQLFAEVIAMWATNEAKEKETKKARIEESAPSNVSVAETLVLGVRVNGSVFHFHGVGRSPEVLKSMQNLQVASDTTITIRLGDEAGFDFLIPEQRKQIIYILDKFLENIMDQGRNSERQNSK